MRGRQKHSLRAAGSTESQQTNPESRIQALGCPRFWKGPGTASRLQSVGKQLISADSAAVSKRSSGTWRGRPIGVAKFENLNNWFRIGFSVKRHFQLLVVW